MLKNEAEENAAVCFDEENKRELENMDMYQGG